MSNLNVLVTEDRRLAITRLLADSTSYQAGAPMLQMALAGLGHGVSLDTVTADLAWLRDAALLSLRDISGVHIVTLTARGLDVARGLTTVPGVARLRPE